MLLVGVMESTCLCLEEDKEAMGWVALLTKFFAIKFLQTRGVKSLR